MYTMSEKEIERLRIDIAGSFFMDLIGQNMQEFVKILQKIITPPTPYLAEGLEKLHVENVTLERKFDNALIPIAQPKQVNILEVHWLFVVKNENSQTKKVKDLTANDYTVFNSYKKKMQVEGSHQFCQSHALYMAYKYYMGEDCPITNPRDAFDNLLVFWDLLIRNMSTIFKSKKNVAIILKPIFAMNLDQEPNQQLVKHVIKNFPEGIRGIYDILNSDEAKYYCPTWK